MKKIETHEKIASRQADGRATERLLVLQILKKKKKEREEQAGIHYKIRKASTLLLMTI
jgi:hypothetical protein